MSGALAITVLMALTPIATAAHPSTTLLAPYIGTHSAATKYSDATCGSAAGAGGLWKPNSGAFTEAAKASVHSCPYIGGFPYAYSDRSDSIAAPISLPFQGEYNASIAFNWKIDPAMSLSAGTCPVARNVSTGYDAYECIWDVYWDAEVSLTLYDQTNGTFVAPAYGYWVAQNYSEVYDYNYCQSGACYFTNVTFGGSSAYDSDYQAVYGNYLDEYLGNGLSTGTANIWTNSTTWDAAANTGTNYTLLLSHSYVVIATIGFYASAQLDGYHFYSTGTGGNTVYFSPSGSASSVVSASGAGHGLKVTSIAYNLV